jgi:hypothetical protein
MSAHPLVFADLDGRVMRLDLASGEQIPLSAPGIYQPGDLLEPYPFDGSPAQWTPVLSPDLRFLALPDPSGSGTWLVDLTGAEPARELLDTPAMVSWSPDGSAIAWIVNDRLSVQDIPGGEPRVLAEIAGLLNMAWSPRGEAIAVAVGSPDQARVTLSLVNVESGAMKVLTDARPVTPTGGGIDLAWTADGSEVWYAPAMIGYSVEAQAIVPLLSPHAFPRERQTMYALSATPDQQHYAYPALEKERADRALQLTEGLSFSNVLNVAFDQPWEAYAWTEEGNTLVVQEGAGAQARLWRISAGFRAPTPYIQAMDAGEILASGVLIGTRSHLAQYHRQIAPQMAPTRLEPPSPEFVDKWGGMGMSEARLSVEFPMYWNYNWPGMGDVATTVSNFGMISGLYLLSLSPEWVYTHFDAFTPQQGTAQAFLEEAVFSPRANAEWKEISLDGRPGYRVRWKDRPTHEAVFVPFEDNTIVRIQKYPLHSDHDLDFERMLQSVQWLPPDQWALQAYPTETPGPTQAAAPELRLAGALPALHWREGLALVAVTNRGEIVRASATRLTFYDPANLEVTRTGLITLTDDLALNTINADGTRLARARGNTVEILDLTALNEQGDPPILGTFQEARRSVMKLAFAPDGNTIAVVSQAVRDDLGPALLKIYDMQRLRSFGFWEVSGVPELSFSPDSRWLARSVDFGTGTISYYAIDPAAGTASEFTIQGQDVWESAAFSADSHVLLAAAAESGIVSWTIPEGNLVRSWDIHPTCCVVSDLAIDPHGRYLAMSSPDGLELRRLADGTLAGFAKQEVNRIAFVAKGTDLFLAGMYGDGVVMIWSIEE